MELKYDLEKWEELSIVPVNTLQLFITNKCNMRCKGCFCKSRLACDGEMSLTEFRKYIDKYHSQIQKVIILGGEPTLHQKLPEMVAYTQQKGLKTTIYTNGYNLGILKDASFQNLSVRLSVYGVNSLEKPINKIIKLDIPVMIVYMLRKNNVGDLPGAAEIAEKLGCKKMFISSIRDIAVSGSYWKDTEETLPLPAYTKVVQKFIDDYRRNMEIHISRRGMLKTEKSAGIIINKCRFGNIFPNGDKISCPFDICKNLLVNELKFNERQCDKNCECLLRKIVLKRK